MSTLVDLAISAHGGMDRRKTVEYGVGAPSGGRHFGDHRITRTFAVNADGSLPDQTILSGLRNTWRSFDKWKARRTVTMPTLWLADLRGPKPLNAEV